MSSNKKIEFIVGFFVVLVLLAFGWLTTQMGKLQLKKQPTYTLYAMFNDAGGLNVNTKVKIAGVDVGYVKSIGLRGGKAIVAIAIYDKYKIPVDSVAVIKSKSLLGEKTLEIVYGKSDRYLKNGQFISHSLSPVSLGTLLTNVNKVFNQQNRANISKALEKISELTEKLNEMVQENRKNIHDAIANFNKSMQALAEILRNNKQDVRIAVIEAREALQKLNDTLQNLYLITDNVKEGRGTLGKLIVDESLYNNVDNASKYLNDIFAKINSGKGTLGKLVNNDEVYNNLNDTLKSIEEYLKRGNQMSLNVYAADQYNFRDSYNKGIINLDIYTMPDKFYRIGIVNEKNYEYTEHPNNRDTKTRITAMIGKRYYNFILRAGVEESRFGVGVDYLFGNNFKASFDIYDFNHENDIRDKHPHGKLQFTYKWMRHFDLFAGVDEVFNRRTRTAFAGAGIEFSSNDAKYLMGKMPSISPK